MTKPKTTKVVKKRPKAKSKPVSPHKTPTVVDITKYYSSKPKTWKESPTEKRIRQTLTPYNLLFLQEVSFLNFGNPRCPYRFDFYLPDYSLIIEYDGKHHSQKKIVSNDKIKNTFCRLNGLTMFRLKTEDYTTIEQCIKNLLKTLNIPLK